MNMTTAAQRYAHIQAQLDKSWRVFDPQRVTFLRQVLAWLGHPEQHYRIIQIAGTNGKGSTGTMVKNILQTANLQVGHFTSPAVLVDEEQIWLNDRYVQPAEFVRAYDSLVATLAEHDLPADALSYFEVWFFVSLLIFAEQQVDYAIIEAGLGGLHDATNAIDTPDIVAFTEIGFDHQAILGPTLMDIARNKAALIKPQSVVVSDLQQAPEVMAILQQQCRTVGAVWQATPIDVQVDTQQPEHLHISIDGVAYDSGLQGAFQARNVQVVWQILTAMTQRFGQRIATSIRQKGLAKAHMIGRLEVDVNKRLVWDGAHNVDAAQALVATLSEWQLPVKPLLILGVLRDKTVDAILSELLPAVGDVWTITPDNPRALPAQELTQQIRAMAPDKQVHTSTPATIWPAILAQQGPQQYVVVAGSFYTIRALRKESSDETTFSRRVE